MNKQTNNFDYNKTHTPDNQSISIEKKVSEFLLWCYNNHPSQIEKENYLLHNQDICEFIEENFNDQDRL